MQIVRRDLKSAATAFHEAECATGYFLHIRLLDNRDRKPRMNWTCKPNAATPSPSVSPKGPPSALPTTDPTPHPTPAPTISPTMTPTQQPTELTEEPTPLPTSLPTAGPAQHPIASPTDCYEPGAVFATGQWEGGVIVKHFTWTFGSCGSGNRDSGYYCRSGSCNFIDQARFHHYSWPEQPESIGDSFLCAEYLVCESRCSRGRLVPGPAERKHWREIRHISVVGIYKLWRWTAS